MIISSLQNPTIKLIRSLANKKYRVETRLFVAEGEKVLQRAYSRGWVPETLVSTGAVSPWGDARLLEATPEVMASLSAQNNALPMLGVFRQKWQEKVEPAGLWLALEDMRDPGNLGTIVRTADAVGAEGVILAGQSCDPWSRECVRATMGSIFAVPLVRMALPALVDLCANWPGETIGAHLQGTDDYRKTYGDPTLIIMGSEGRGLSDALAKTCSTLVRIPMREGPDSLNVAVAAGLILFEVRRNTLPIDVIPAKAGTHSST
ncbi:MAG TPA: RNA methyltransferase [Aestuariivirga sp.]|nr:RNA methyltransferase [Aestuariivirga sp.]